MQHPLETNREARELAARFMARANKGALAALRAGIELSTGSLPTYLARTLPKREMGARKHAEQR
jgi:6-phosphogluconolactonase/glucosamine-6-phosphate isomerase/deaminase